MAKTISEQRLLQLFVAALVVMSATGMLNHFGVFDGKYQQVSAILHLISGLLSSGVALFYGYQHSKLTLAFRRITSIVMGTLAFVSFLIALITGLFLAVTGVTERYDNWLNVHHFSSYASVVGIVIHVIIHWLTFPARRTAQGGKFKTLDWSILKPIGLASLGAVVLFGFTLLLDKMVSPAPMPTPVANYTYNYDASGQQAHFLPSLSSTEDNQFIAIDHIAQSKQCIACHQTIGEQWLASAHRHAANDPTYVRNINLLEQKKGIEAGRYCEGCHAPIALLSGQLSEGGKHAGVQGTVANDEGVSCLSCHGVSKIHSTQGNAGYHFSPADDYLFAQSSVEWLKSISNLSIKLRPQQHKQQLLAPVQQTAAFCSACHSQFMDESMNNWGFVKMQNEYLAWSESKFNQSRDTRFTHPDNKNCQSCHMPHVQGHGMAANQKGEVRSHYFVGGNVMLAKQFDNEALYQQTKAFLQQDKLSIYIVPPEDKQAQQSVLFVNPNTGVTAKHPIALYRGQTRKLTVLVNNHGVGHNFPAGTIDLSEAWVELKVIDGNGETVFSSGHLQNDRSIEPNATVYKETALNHQGDEVWRHDLFNMVGRSYINYIPAGATDVIEYPVTIPDWAVSPLNVSATLKFRKLNPRYANWVEQKQHIKANPIIDIARDSLAVTLKKVPGLE